VKIGRKRGGSMVPEADDKTKSGITAGIWRSKMKKENWVGGLNARLDRTADWAGEKNIAKSMRWDKKIGERILASQNGKEKRK
jgi:hypothetical protein